MLHLPHQPAEALVSLWRPLQAVVDHGGYGQGPSVAAQESDVMAVRQAAQAALRVHLGLLQEGGLPEDVVQVQVEQRDAFRRRGRARRRRRGAEERYMTSCWKSVQ